MTPNGKRKRLRLPMLIVAAIVASAAGLLVEYQVGGSGLKPRGHQSGVGTAQLIVDTTPSTLGTLTLSTTAQTLEDRAPLYAEYGTGTLVKDRVAQIVGIPATHLSILASTDQTVSPNAQSPPGISPKAPSTPYTVTLSATSTTPVVTISADAPDAAAAQRLAAATSQALAQSIASLPSAQVSSGSGLTGRPGDSNPGSLNNVSLKIVLRPLGAAQGSTVFAGKSAKKAVGIGVAVFIVLLIVALILDNLALSWRERRTARRAAAT